MGANEMSTRRCYVSRYYDHSKLLQMSCANSFIPIRFDNIELIKKNVMSAVYTSSLHLSMKIKLYQYISVGMITKLMAC